MKKSYNYDEIKEMLKQEKQKLIQQLEGRKLTSKEQQTLHMSIANYDYILELVDMNHFNRGLQRFSQRKRK